MKKKIAIFVLLLFLVCGCGKTNDKTSLSYEITIKDSDNILTTTEVKKGELLEQPEDPTKEGYIFIRWVSNGETFDFSKPVSEDLTLEAEWYKINEDDENTVYVIKFDSEGGTTIENQIVIEGNTIIKPNDPVKDGYTFISWGVNGVDYDFSEKVDGDRILTAIWKYNNISSSDENISLAAPRLSSISSEKGTAELSVVYAGDYDIKEDKNNIKSLNIDGWELYEKDGNSYNKIDENSTFDNIKVTIELGKTRIFVARVYKNNNGTKVYSDYSNELSFSNKLSTPKLVTPEIADGTYYFDISYNGSYNSNNSERNSLSGWEIYENVNGTYKLFKSGTKFTGMGSVKIEPNESRLFKCRVYVLNNKNEKVYSSYSSILTLKNTISEPELVTPEVADGIYYFDISYNGSYQSDDHTRDILNGWEIYEKVDGNYKLFKSGTTFTNMGNAKLSVSETRTFKCRVYALNSKNEKVYSDYSKELVLTNNTSLLTPKLVTPEVGPGYYVFDISYNGSYQTGDHTRDDLDGWEIYEKVNGSYQLFASGTTFSGMGTVTPSGSESRIFKCRVYVLNSKNEKVYSDYSNELTLKNNLSKPILVTPEQGSGYYVFDISYNGSYQIDDHTRDDLDGWEIYEKVNGSYQLFKSGTNFSSDMGTISLDFNETRTFKCRIYVLNSSNAKVYSDYSSELTLKNNLSKPVLVTPEVDDGTYYFDISYDGSYQSDDHTRDNLDGWEIYEKVNGSYQLFKSGTTFNGMGSITLNSNETRTFRCRVYALNSNNEKVYSEYSNDLVLTNN